MSKHTHFEVVTAVNDGASTRAPREWPKYMTARVAADYCDTSPWTIRRHVQPCGRRGKSFIYAIEQVERWMRGQSLDGSKSATHDHDGARQRGVALASKPVHVSA